MKERREGSRGRPAARPLLTPPLCQPLPPPAARGRRAGHTGLCCGLSAAPDGHPGRGTTTEVRPARSAAETPRVASALPCQVRVVPAAFIPRRLQAGLGTGFVVRGPNSQLGEETAGGTWSSVTQPGSKSLRCPG